jgi:hypothetical protein
LKRVRTTGRAEPETLAEGMLASAMAPVWSPDGASILAANGGLKLIATQGATMHDLHVEDSPCVFARTEPLIYCLRAPRPDGKRAWLALDHEGNIAREVAFVPFHLAPADRFPGDVAPTLTFSMSPDGNAVTYSTVTNTADLWLMEGLAAVELP